MGESFKIFFPNKPAGTLSSTGNYGDYYVYEWYIVETNEIFYVGKGRGDRFKQKHERNQAFETIKKKYDCECRFVAMNLTESEAIKLESDEILRVLNETDNILTNYDVPAGGKRDSGYYSIDIPLQREIAPPLTVTEIESHYFGLSPWFFPDSSKAIEKLKGLNVYMYLKDITRRTLFEVYGDNFIYYYDQTVAALQKQGAKIVKSKNAKSVDLWIICGIEFLSSVNIEWKKHFIKTGSKVGITHLLSLWPALHKKYGDIPIEEELVEINPINNRVPYEEIPDYTGDDKAEWQKECYRNCVRGDRARQAGQYEEAIKYYDLARPGWWGGMVINGYAAAYRALKDYDNEIDILREGIEHTTNVALKVHWRDRMHIAEKLLMKSKSNNS